MSLYHRGLPTLIFNLLANWPTYKSNSMEHVLAEKLVVLPALADHEHALSFSQPPATYRYPVPDESIPNPFIVLLKYSLCIPLTPSPCKWNLTVRFSIPNSVLISLFPMHATCPTDLIPPWFDYPRLVVSCGRFGATYRSHLNTFTAVVDLSRFNNSCLKSPASTLVDLTFQSRALRSALSA